MKKTKLQVLLLNNGHCLTVRQALQASRYTVRLWRMGECFPNKANAEKLIALFPELDFNGCYKKTEELV